MARSGPAAGKAKSKRKRTTNNNKSNKTVTKTKSKRRRTQSKTATVANRRRDPSKVQGVASATDKKDAEMSSAKGRGSDLNPSSMVPHYGEASFSSTFASAATDNNGVDMSSTETPASKRQKTNHTNSAIRKWCFPNGTIF